MEAVKEMTGGIGVDSALECVGTGQSLATAMAVARPGSVVGAIGAPHGIDFSVMDAVVYRNVGLRGGVAAARVFDFETNLDGIVEAYEAMDQRRAIKSLIQIGAA